MKYEIFKYLLLRTTEPKIQLLNIVLFQMQTYFLVADDIMDGAETRRGKPCWYKKDNIGMMAFNDALIIETCIYSILERHLKDHKQYSALVHAFLQVIFYHIISISVYTINIEFRILRPTFDNSKSISFYRQIGIPPLDNL